MSPIPPTISVPPSSLPSDTYRKRRPTESQDEFRLAAKSQLETVTTTLEKYLDSVADRSSDPLYLALKACVEVLKQTHQHYLQPSEDPIETEKRNRSIVIENLPESSRSLASERVDDDYSHIKKILDAADIEVRPETVFRMGERRAGKVRPLKVILPRVSSQRALLRQTKKINDRPEYSSVRIRPSLTEKERKEQFDLRAKKRELNAKGEGVYVIYAGELMKKDQVGAYKASHPMRAKSRPTTPSIPSLSSSAFPAFTTGNC
ncbi:hypothetical protein PRIPAC_72950 [Pristionchus pacificus]|uniref:Uncharacterized protein n=1 Tax=Pristionchus pacificus TaxID=54126 RepID=A0A2A6B3Q9_PRIPA|nr:hypothetical protein PRIPAC_88902 [Pristionchus pacificus]KAF8364004.1 hypothetical protein PRIPAC_90927 [Pristionchus pacificus]KAF8373400.1 hypothetical protein PRIPAC_79829 [Pristionchus pacificus]KAF8383808.1 hypothetical protein PRIPAC_72950 [Pristionchus pacificus]|eukprot:PDM60498.1 hypothetical protein PRIPAC_53476 [Pristionchus pacificus]